jgi:hypothetical protein
MTVGMTAETRAHRSRTDPSLAPGSRPAGLRPVAGSPAGERRMRVAPKLSAEATRRARPREARALAVTAAARAPAAQAPAAQALAAQAPAAQALAARALAGQSLRAAMWIKRAVPATCATSTQPCAAPRANAWLAGIRIRFAARSSAHAPSPPASRTACASATTRCVETTAFAWPAAKMVRLAAPIAGASAVAAPEGSASRTGQAAARTWAPARTESAPTAGQKKGRPAATEVVGPI